MKKVLVGKIHNTHGLNGEVKVSSSFLLKNKVFIKGFKVYIDDLEYIINKGEDLKNRMKNLLNNYISLSYEIKKNYAKTEIK